MDEKAFSDAEQDLASEWAEKWLELVGLINEVTGTDEPPWSPPPPSDLDEIHYQSLRFWFLDHQEQFNPMWKDYQRCNMGSLFQDYESEDELHPEYIKYRENPLLYLYEPESLYRLACHLDLQSGVDMWEPSEYRASRLRPLLIRTGELMVEFLAWLNKG